MKKMNEDQAKKEGKELLDKYCPIIRETAFNTDKQALGEHVADNIGVSLAKIVSKFKWWDQRDKVHFQSHLERPLGEALSEASNINEALSNIKDVIWSIAHKMPSDDSIMNDLCEAGLHLMRFWAEEE